MKTIKAVKDKIFVEIVTETMTKGGLVLPENFSDSSPHRIGRVISVGDEVCNIVPGDYIAFAKHGGQATILDNKHYMILMYGEIYGIVVDSDSSELV